MKVSDLVKMMVVVTVLAVLYIHVQMNIYAMAYQGSSRQQKIDKLVEMNAIIKNDITRLQSSDHIGRSLLAKGKSYQFAGPDHVVEVASNHESLPEMIASGAEVTGGFLSQVMTIAFASPDRVAIR